MADVNDYEEASLADDFEEATHDGNDDDSCIVVEDGTEANTVMTIAITIYLLHHKNGGNNIRNGGNNIRIGGNNTIHSPPTSTNHHRPTSTLHLHPHRPPPSIVLVPPPTLPRSPSCARRWFTLGGINCYSFPFPCEVWQVLHRMTEVGR